MLYNDVMGKKVTIEEIANLAGVSITTVSFVLNNRDEQKISEETKKKVLQIVNLLGYRPSAFAKNIRKSKEKKIIALYTSFSAEPLKKALICDFLEKIVHCFSSLQYGVLFLDEQDKKVDIADAIVSLGLTKENFHRFGENNFIPLIAVDSIINDPVFFQITTDYEKLNSLAKKDLTSPFTYVDIPHNDNQLNEEIKAAFQNVIFVESITDILRLSGLNIVVNNEVLHDLLSENNSVYFNADLQKEKCSQIVKCTQFALSRETYPTHNFKI